MENLTHINPQESRDYLPDINYASFFGESILPPSIEGEKITREQLSNSYPVRQKVWEIVQPNISDRQNNLTSHIPDQQHIEEIKSILHILNQLDRYEGAHYSNEVGRVLKERQMRVFEDIHDFFEKGNTEGYVEAPTGFGKTVLFGQVVAAMDTTTTIVVPTKRLVEQTYKKLREFNPHLEVGRVYEKRKEYNRQITVTTYDSMVRNSESEEELRNRQRTKLVVFDEVHEGLSDKRMKAAETFKNALFLGVTATPATVESETSNTYRVAKLTHNEIHSIPFREAVEEGYLAPFSAYLIEVDLDISGVKITGAGDYSSRDLDKVINEKAANEAAIQFFLEMRRRDIEVQKESGNAEILPLTTAVFASSVQHAQNLAREALAQGIQAAAVWGDQDQNEQDEILRKVESGEIEMVCSKNLLVRGIDIQKIRLIENVAPTASATVEKQRVGRGLRLDLNNPNKHTIVADFVYKNLGWNNRQVLFPQIADGVSITKSQTTPSSTPSQNAAYSQRLENIQMQGLKVITNPEQVLSILNRNGELIPPPSPDGWLVVGTSRHSNTLAGNLGKSSEWVTSRIPQVVQKLKEKQREEGIPTEEQESYYGEFVDKEGKKRMHYAPQVYILLKEMLDNPILPPDGWNVAGDLRLANTICSEIGKSYNWFKGHLPAVIAEIESEWDEKEVPQEEREPLFGEYRVNDAAEVTYYSPIIVKKLQKVIEQEYDKQAPEGWYRIGDRERNTLTNILGKSRPWIEARLPQAISALQKEYESGNIPFDEHTFAAEFSTRKGLTLFYSPEVIQKLKELKDQHNSPPEGWLSVGIDLQEGSLTEIIPRSTNWIRRHLAQIIKEIQQEKEEGGIEVDKQEPLFGEFLGKGGKVTVFYAPEVVERLKERASKNEKLR